MDATIVDAAVSEQARGQTAFPIVGIGASAGGLEAINRLLEQLPASTGMAYVVVQHLDPTHTSILPSLLRHATQMPTRTVEDGMVVEVNRVYIIPPGTDMTIAQGVFTLIPRTETGGQHLSIDTFFRSLAHESKHQAIGILLSGTGSDGTLGLWEIKAEDGTTFAQEESSAAYQQMPHHAIAAGCVDMVLPPEAIAAELTRLSLHPYIVHHTVPEPQALLPEDEQAFTKILLTLRRATGVDFLAYKPPTLHRRILRRMLVLRIEQPAHYVAYLQEHADEVELLYEDFLIKVTSFFRDQAAFDSVTRVAFPELLKYHTLDQPIRIWVPGCATGEEVYSLAICLCEFLEAESLSFPVQFFATDIDPAALTKARTGVYPASALSGISPQRLERFFLPLSAAREEYQVSKLLREWCVFALHNIGKDPPYSRLDLVSCRNVLMYFGSLLQKKVMQTFNYALKPHGFLLLGTAESATAFSGLFTRVENAHSLYVKKDIGVKPPFSFLFSDDKRREQIDGKVVSHILEDALGGQDAQREADRLLLLNYAPACVVVDADMEILHVRGQTDPYLGPAPGKASLNLLKMARAGLGLGLRAAINAARKSNSRVTRDGLYVRAFGSNREVSVTVIPLKGPPSERCYLVLFADVAPVDAQTPGIEPAIGQTGKTRKRSTQERKLAALEQEIVGIQAEMQAILEDSEHATEQLQTAIEEVRSSNEELQSLNEELETSKEEQQSLNEELTTANQELLAHNEQIRTAQEYAEAIIETVGESLVVLNKDLQVQQANSSFYQFFGMTTPQAEGCPLKELGQGQWNIPQLQVLLQEALTLNQPLYNFEIEDNFPPMGHKNLLLNAHRILQKGEEIENQLLLLAIEDISERKAMERQKDVLLSMTGHELKTPLTAAKLTVQMLQHHYKKAGDERFVIDLADINGQLNKLTLLINGLLDATAIETGRLVIHMASFAVDDLVRDIVEELGRTTPTHRLLIKEQARCDGYGDRARTGEVLANLLSNAIKYAPPTQPINVRARADQEHITLSVQDRGVGIAKEQHEKIFGRFTRAAGVTQDDVPGLGLGLYIAVEIVKRQGGRIWVESAPGKGSTFFFTLPRRGTEHVREA